MAIGHSNGEVGMRNSEWGIRTRRRSAGSRTSVFAYGYAETRCRGYRCGRRKEKKIAFIRGWKPLPLAVRLKSKVGTNLGGANRSGFLLKPLYSLQV